MKTDIDTYEVKTWVIMSYVINVWKLVYYFDYEMEE